MSAALKLSLPVSPVLVGAPVTINWTLTENYVFTYLDGVGGSVKPQALPAGSVVPPPIVNTGSFVHAGFASAGNFSVTLREARTQTTASITVPVKVAPKLIESLDGTVLTSPAGSITDSALNVWTLVQSASSGLQMSVSPISPPAVSASAIIDGQAGAS